MTTPQELLFGMPINPIDNIPTNPLPTRFVNLYNNQFGQPLFAPIGTGGMPDASQHPMSAFNYLHNKRSIIERSAYQRPLIRLADRNLNVIGTLTGEIALDFEELMIDSGSARWVADYSNWMVDYIVNLTKIESDLHLLIDPIPSLPTWRTRWGGKIHTINVQKKEDGTSIIELQAVSNREHAKRLLYAASPFLAPELQLPKMWILPGPIRTVLFLSGFVNLARLFVPGLSFLTNIFNPGSWVNPLNAESLFQTNPLDWPIQFAFVDPALDQSRWTVLGATWTTWHDATTDMLKDAGCMLRCYTWLLEDEDSPYDDELAPLLGNHQLEAIANAIVRPTRNCVIFRCEDKSGQTGPTGTALDGLLNVIGVTLDDMFSSTLIDANTGLSLDGEPLFDVNNSNFPIFESLLGVAPAPPKVIWREGDYSPIIDATHFINKAMPKTMMTGGRSPTIVNELQTFGIKWALSQLQDLINPALGTMINTAYQTPLTPGLQNLYQGQLDNTVLAWQRFTDPIRALWVGDIGFQEYFERGSGTAYTMSSVLTIRTALWKTRAFQGFKAKVFNGFPWTIDADTVLGDRNGFEFNGMIFVDQIYGVKRSVQGLKPYITEITIGDDKYKYDPVARTIRALQGMYQLFSAFFLEDILFG